MAIVQLLSLCNGRMYCWSTYEYCIAKHWGYYSAIKMLDTMLCCYERAPVTQRPNKQTSAHAYIEASFAWLRLQFYDIIQLGTCWLYIRLIRRISGLHGVIFQCRTDEFGGVDIVGLKSRCAQTLHQRKLLISNIRERWVRVCVALGLCLSFGLYIYAKKKT